MTPEVREQLAWAAGLLEGEGCFYARTQGGRSYPTVSCGMTDEDVIRKLMAFFDAGYIFRSKKSGFGTKPIYTWQVTTRQARTVMTYVLPYMGARRRAKIEELLRLPVRAGNYKCKKEIRL